MSQDKVKMVWLRFLHNCPKRCVELSGVGEDGKPLVANRSADGDTLLVAPGHSKEVTDAEWKHIQERHADLVPHIQVLDIPQPVVVAKPVAKLKQSVKAEPVTDEPAPDMPAPNQPR